MFIFNVLLYLPFVHVCFNENVKLHQMNAYYTSETIWKILNFTLVSTNLGCICVTVFIWDWIPLNFQLKLSVLLYYLWIYVDKSHNFTIFIEIKSYWMDSLTGIYTKSIRMAKAWGIHLKIQWILSKSIFLNGISIVNWF